MSMSYRFDKNIHVYILKVNAYKKMTMNNMLIHSRKEVGGFLCISSNRQKRKGKNQLSNVFVSHQ